MMIETTKRMRESGDQAGRQATHDQGYNERKSGTLMI